MKNLLLALLSSIFSMSLNAQTTEWRVAFNSGVFFFRENVDYSTGSSTFFGKSGQIVGLSTNVQRVTNSNFIFGADLGVEVLRQYIEIGSHDYVQIPMPDFQLPFNQNHYNVGYVNFNPFLGYRKSTKNIIFDFTGGIDIVYCLRENEIGNPVDKFGDQFIYAPNHSRLDFRPHIQVNANYKKAGVYLGYSHGLINYETLNPASTLVSHTSYSRLFRFGVTCKIK